MVPRADDNEVSIVPAYEAMTIPCQVHVRQPPLKRPAAFIKHRQSFQIMRCRRNRATRHINLALQLNTLAVPYVAFEWFLFAVICDLARLDLPKLIMKLECLLPLELPHGLREVQQIKQDDVVIVDEMQPVLDCTDVAALNGPRNLHFVEVLAKQLPLDDLDVRQEVQDELEASRGQELPLHFFEPLQSPRTSLLVLQRIIV